MFQLVIAIQFVSISVLFIECWVVFLHWRNAVHSYLFLSCATTLINNVGYLLELCADSEDKYFTALQFSYFGRIWIPFALALFIAELVQVKVPQVIKVLLALLNIVTYISVVTTKSTGLYYKNTSFRMIGQFPCFEHENGIMHNLWTAVIVILIVFGMGFLFSRVGKEKYKTAKWRLRTVVCAIFAESIFLLIEITHLLPITEIYDVTMLGFTIGAVFMSVAIFRYKLLDTRNLAREYVIDELSEGIIAVNEDGDVSYFNKPAQLLFPEIETDAQSVIDMLRRAIDAEEPIRLGDRVYSPSKNILSKAGEVAGIIYAITDDTEHYRYIEELSEQKQIADEANKAKSSFLANMSHEIRTPINAVLGMDEMILREAKDRSILSYAEDIRAAGRTLLSIINDILDFSKIEEGKMEIIQAQYELSSVIIDLMNMVRERARKKGLELVLNVDSNVPHILYGDEIRIRQVILNLLTNAVKYTEKGKVELGISFFKYTGNEIMLCVKVSDTGIGMKEEDMEKLFSPFSRIEEKRNRSIEGTGLGMSIVKQLLSLMNSRLEVESTYGKGSQFSFEVKQRVIKWEPMGDVAARFEAEVAKEEDYQELFRAPDARVLVVDDTEVNLTVIRNLLKSTKVYIDTASSGMEALKLVAENKYDVAFIDHMMPEMDGIETLNRIKEMIAAKDMISIALTANAITGAREMYLKAGFTDYMSKPVEGRVLEEMLRKYLPEDKIVYEKAHEESDQEDSVDNEPPGDELPQWLLKVEELDVEKGIESCGSVESFLSVLKVFHQSAAMKADEIEKLYADGDIANYTIKVHGLKSSSRIIGAVKLSEMAKKLEAAGNAGNMEELEEGTGPLIAMYRDINEKLTRLGGVKKELKELSESMRIDAFQTMAEAAGINDYGIMDNLIHDLADYKLSEEDEKLLKQVEEKLMELDWEGINAIVTEACKKVL